MSISRARPADRGTLERFIHSEVSGSVVLLACTAVALVWANSRWSDTYFAAIHARIGISWGSSQFAMSLQHWVNDLVMAVFFFMVGLEIKRELVVGELASARKAVLPVAAALGGMLVPAGIYALVNGGGEGARGWAIPMATDIAFALGVLSIAGRRVPMALKVFLTALAIADDLGAVMVLALFYSTRIVWIGVLVAAGFLLLIGLLVRLGVRSTGVFIVLALGAWIGVLTSGVHATVEGILVAFVIPVRPRRDAGTLAAAVARFETSGGATAPGQPAADHSPLDAITDLQQALREMLPIGLTIEERLHAPVAFLCLPLFALCNAGVTVDGPLLRSLSNPVGLGVVAGLLLGKQLGIVSFAWVAVRAGWAALPATLRWTDIYAAASLAGIGFTMSLFFTELAFSDQALAANAKIGILTASVAAAAWGSIVLAARSRRASDPPRR